VLTGKYKPGSDFPADSRAAQSSMNTAMHLVMSDATLAAVQRLVPIAEGAGLTLPELALAWVLRRDEVASAIVGASRPEQVHANAAAAGIELSEDVLAAVDGALGDVPQSAPRLATNAAEGVKHR
jgi:aryl-alcohol dehydrogenase-like predicted oxidoreductase